MVAFFVGSHRTYEPIQIQTFSTRPCAESVNTPVGRPSSHLPKDERSPSVVHAPAKKSTMSQPLMSRRLLLIHVQPLKTFIRVSSFFRRAPLATKPVYLGEENLSKLQRALLFEPDDTFYPQTEELLAIAIRLSRKRA